MSVQKMIQALDDLNSIHVTLLELGEQKQRVLINNQVNELTQITNQESKLMKQVSEQEKLWLEQTANFLAEKGFTPNPSITMTELIQLVFNAEDKQALITVRQKLLDTVNKLKKLNALNQELIEQSLSFIDYTLDLLTDDPNELLGYSNPNDKPKLANKNTMFDTRA